MGRTGILHPRDVAQGQAPRDVPAHAALGRPHDRAPGLLAVARLHGFGGALSKHRRCEAVARSTGRRCKCAAMNFARYCTKHGGPRDAAKRRPYVPGKFAQRAIAERALRLRP